MKKQKQNSGITLIMLIVIIIVLLILAGISVVSVVGENGIINKAMLAKVEDEISEEKEIVNTAVAKAYSRDEDNLTYDNLYKALKNLANGLTELEEDDENNVFRITFKESGRFYEVNSDREITSYVDNSIDLTYYAEISANPEKIEEPAYSQTVEITVKTIMAYAEEDVTLNYAWLTQNTTYPTSSDSIINTGLEGNNKIHKVLLTSPSVSEDTSFYLWAQVVFDDGEKTEWKCFGPYDVKEKACLIAVGLYDSSDSGLSTSAFLGNKFGIKRRSIRSITLEDNFDNIITEKSWDVTAPNSKGVQTGKVLAWYEEVDDTDYYDVYIAQDGGVVANAYSSYLFSYIGYSVTTGGVAINNLNLLDTSNVTTMYYMFYYCNSLTSLDVSNFDTSQVTSMYDMFAFCKSLKSLDLSNFDTSQVTNMAEMFDFCSSLTSLDLSNFNTSKVTNMSYMFFSCSSLTNLDVSNFNTSKVTNMSYMFYCCVNLTKLNVSKFDTSAVINMSDMFASCRSLTSLDVSNFNTSKVTNMEYMFSGCISLTSLDLSSFNTSQVTNMQAMFSSSSSLTSVDVSNFNTSKVINMKYMFSSSSSLTNVDVSNFDTSKVTNMEYMFYACSSLTSLDVSNFNTSQVTNMGGIFGNCKKIKNLDLSNFDTSNVIDMNRMFFRCTILTSVNLSNFNTSKVTDMECMFYYCSSLINLDLSNFNTSNVTSMHSMFFCCDKLTTIYASTKWSTSAVTDGSNMFDSCSKLVGAISFSSSKTDYTYANYTTGYFTYKAATK